MATGTEQNGLLQGFEAKPVSRRRDVWSIPAQQEMACILLYIALLAEQAAQEPARDRKSVV